jgi:hypothetical protein
MDQHTARRNAKDLFAVGLKVVDTFFAAELLDRLDPNVAIEMPKTRGQSPSFLNRHLS